jgi:glutathione S-transferase
MKLYYSPFACSLASHIACREAGLDFELSRAELATKRVEDGADLYDVNPMGQVPTLVLDDGRRLTENTAVLTFIADRAPDKHLAPAPAAFERYELSRWLSFVGTEIHKKGLAMIFAPDTSDAVKDYARSALAAPLAVAEAQLSRQDVLLGEHFSVADAYLFWAVTIMQGAGVDLAPYPALRAYRQRHRARPAVSAAVGFESEQYQRPFTVHSS